MSATQSSSRRDARKSPSTRSEPGRAAASGRWCDTNGGDALVVEPTATEALEQFGVELAVARRHLYEIRDHYWDHDWRAENRLPHRPEDHLWRSSQGVREVRGSDRDRPVTPLPGDVDPTRIVDRALAGSVQGPPELAKCVCD